MGFAQNNKEIIKHLTDSTCIEMRSVIKVLDMIKEICDKEECLKIIGESVEEQRKAAYTLLGGMGTVATEIEEVPLFPEDKKTCTKKDS